MEHPLAGNLDELSNEELHTRLTELNKKLMTAYSLGNGSLIHQLTLLIETYREKINDRNKKNNTDFGDKIDIS